MAQVFSRRALLTVKLSLIGLPLILWAAIAVYRWRTAPPEAIGAAVPQPIPFSHKHHVGDDGIDCRYCHSTVETSRSAGMPATSTCLTCHSQLFNDAPLLSALKESQITGRPISWQRVNDLPDFVYFDHSIHIHKGISCAQCHGPVEQMPLTWRRASLHMQWCLDCHRSPEAHLRPADQVVSGRVMPDLSPGDAASLKEALRILSTRRLTDCSTCHR